MQENTKNIKICKGGAEVKWGVWKVKGPRRQAQNTTSSLSLLLRARPVFKSGTLYSLHKNKILQHETCSIFYHDSNDIRFET